MSNFISEIPRSRVCVYVCVCVCVCVWCVCFRIPVVLLYTWKFTKFPARMNIAWEKDSIAHNSDCFILLYISSVGRA